MRQSEPPSPPALEEDDGAGSDGSTERTVFIGTPEAREMWKEYRKREGKHESAAAL